MLNPLAFNPCITPAVTARRTRSVTTGSAPKPTAVRGEHEKRRGTSAVESGE